MSKGDLFTAFGSMPTDYLLAAAASMEAPVRTLPRPRLRFALIAASFLLIAAMIPIFVILARHTTPPPLPPTPVTSDSETSSTPSTEAPTTHLSITDIPGAIPVEPGVLEAPPDSSSRLMHISEYIERTQEKRIAFLGTLLSSESVWVKHSGANMYVHLTAMELQINESVCNADNLNTLRVIYAVWYYPTQTGYCSDPTRALKMDLAIKSAEEPFGFYVLDKSKDYKFYIGDNKYLRMSDYADYMLELHASYDGKNVSYPGFFDVDIEYFRSGYQWK